MLIKADEKARIVSSKSLNHTLLAKDIAFQIVQVQQFLTDVSATHDPAAYKEAEGAARAFKAGIEKFKNLYKNENDLVMFKKVEELENIFNEYYKKGKRMAETYVTEGISAGNSLMRDFDATSEYLTSKVSEFEKFHVNEAISISSYISNTIKKVKTILIVTTLVSMLLATLIAFFITSNIIRSLGKAVNVANSMAQGELSVGIEVDSEDEVGQLLEAVRKMGLNLKGLIAEIKSIAQNIASASQQLNENSEHVSRGMSEQSDRSMQIATSMSEMSQTVNEIAKNASSIAASAIEASRVAKEGGKIVETSITEVREIARAVEESSQLMFSLSNRSRQIGDIVDVINDIAEQTNLLALNAAIEAARAGGQGKGFAVVADEVRKLAERTAKSTSEIGSMIHIIQSEIDRTVISMEEMRKRVNSDVECSAKASEALWQIVEKVEELQSMVQQIASATEEMSATSEEISKDVMTIADLSRETSGSSEHIARASSDLASLAIRLSEKGEQFKI